jgi:hypothetical protein
MNEDNIPSTPEAHDKLNTAKSRAVKYGDGVVSNEFRLRSVSQKSSKLCRKHFSRLA